MRYISNFVIQYTFSVTRILSHKEEKACINELRRKVVSEVESERSVCVRVRKADESVRKQALHR